MNEHIEKAKVLIESRIHSKFCSCADCMILGQTLAELEKTEATEFVCISCGKIDPCFIVECKECSDKSLKKYRDKIDRLTAENKAQAERIKELEQALKVKE